VTIRLNGGVSTNITNWVVKPPVMGICELNIETLLFGNDAININENSIIFNKVRAYIRQTKRF
jgi:hypothetical protein